MNGEGYNGLRWIEEILCLSEFPRSHGGLLCLVFANDPASRDVPLMRTRRSDGTLTSKLANGSVKRQELKMGKIWKDAIPIGSMVLVYMLT